MKDQFLSKTVNLLLSSVELKEAMPNVDGKSYVICHVKTPHSSALQKFALLEKFWRYV